MVRIEPRVLPALPMKKKLALAVVATIAAVGVVFYFGGEYDERKWQ